MPIEMERNPNRWPGVHKEYGLFQRPIGNRNPDAWRLVGKPTWKHDELREIVMPEELIKVFGVAWLDNFSGYEYKIMECTVTRTEWRDEAKPK